MISFDSALKNVLENTIDFGNELIELDRSVGRVLAETILADRDFPPFDRATKDGIAIRFDGIESPNHFFKTAGLAQAGSPQQLLNDNTTCIEVMTGAIVPENADTVIMYEHLEDKDDGFALQKPVKKGQNIHYKGSDVPTDTELLHPGVKITASEIGLLASVGKSTVLVKKLPKVAIISTGNELVEVHEKPLVHQIRKSNSYTLQGLLKEEHINADLFHLVDEPEILRQKLEELLANYDILLLSGGVSKGKFDFLPQTFDALGVEKIFHKVKQRPGKPFWFGKHKNSDTVIFSFPGNPVSTFVGYQVYFKPWLNKILGCSTPKFEVFLKKPMTNTTDLTLFIGVSLRNENGRLFGEQMTTTGSGDLVGLAKIDGFVQLNPGQVLEADEELVPFIPVKRTV